MKTLKMRCAYIFLFFFSLFFSLASAQQPGQQIGKWDHQVIISDMQGRPVKSGYSDVSGNPFVHNEFKIGKIILNNGREFIGIPLRIDIVTHGINFISPPPSKEEGYIGGATVMEVAYIDSSTEIPRAYIFRTGIPPIDNHRSTEFYEVISDGKLLLVKSLSKQIETRKNELSGEVSKEFVLNTDYYVVKDGKTIRLKRDKDFIYSLMIDKSKIMTDFLMSYKSTIKSEQDLKAIFDKYNM